MEGGPAEYQRPASCNKNHSFPEEAYQAMTHSRNESMHEDFSRKVQVRGPSNRMFGIVMSVMLALFALARLRTGAPPLWWLLTVAGAFLLAAMAAPAILGPLNVMWMRIAELLSKVVNPIVMGVLFFGVFTPMGILMRWRGKDTMRLKSDAGTGTYWIPREQPGPSPDSMVNQF